MTWHLVSAIPVSIPFRRAQKHVGEASINSPPDNVPLADTHAFEQVNQPMFQSAYIELSGGVFQPHVTGLSQRC
jgi:hypothetical protein